MKAIILTAGLGRRMRPLTNTTHKTLLPIADTTILRRILEALHANGVLDVCIVTGYRAEDVRNAVLEDFPQLAVEFIHNPQYATTNNVFSMALALEAIDVDDDILLIESDLIFDPRVLEQIIHSRHTNVALVDRYRPGLDGTVVSLASDGAIAQVYPSYVQEENFEFSNKYKTLNIYRFEKEFCRTTFNRLLSFYARAIDNNCYYELLLGVLIYMRATTVYAEHVGFDWAEVDDPNDLQQASFTFDAPARRSIVEEAWGGYWNMPHLDFAFIRNMYFPTPPIISEMKSHLDVLIHSYGSSQRILNRKLSYFEECDENNIFLLNGASQVFPTLARAMAGLTALVPSPTFGEYHRVFPRALTYPDVGSVDCEVLEGSLATADAVVIVNPNNPTGTVIRSPTVLELAISHPQKLFVVDESFIDFSIERSILHDVEQQQLDNVILIKSLSKTLGVPGLRLGFVYTANKQLKEALAEEIPIWNINAVAENFLEILLKHRPALEESFERTSFDRDVFRRRLEEVPAVDWIYPSGANFLLLRLTIDGNSTGRLVDDLMVRELVHVKDVSQKIGGGKGHLRVAVRLPDENERLCGLLERLDLG